MAEAVEEERWAHIRGVTVTSVACFAGIAAGLAANEIATAPDDNLGVVLLLIAIFIQFPIYQVIGFEVEEFGIKDYLYISFMTFCLWFVTWGIMLTTEASLPI